MMTMVFGSEPSLLARREPTTLSNQEVRFLMWLWLRKTSYAQFRTLQLLAARFSRRAGLNWALHRIR